MRKILCVVVLAVLGLAFSTTEAEAGCRRGGRERGCRERKERCHRERGRRRHRGNGGCEYCSNGCGNGGEVIVVTPPDAPRPPEPPKKMPPKEPLPMPKPEPKKVL